MFCILSCTNRFESNTFIVSKKIHEIYQKHSLPSPYLMDLKLIPLHEIEKPYEQVSKIQKEIDIINQSHGIVLVIPEYNGSFPGIFKYFLDQWDEKKSFLYKPFCLVGIGSGIKGGIQALKHIQNVLFYRKSYIYPDFVLIQSSQIENKNIKDIIILNRLEEQVQGFSRFVRNVKNL